jgi:hypothetical protein
VCQLASLSAKQDEQEPALQTQRSLQENLPRPFEFERSGTPTAFVLYWRWTYCELLNEKTADFDR